MAIDSRYKLKTGQEVAYFPPIQNTDNPYLTEAAMHADQANQLEGYGYLVDVVGAFTYLGTVAGTAADYEEFGVNDADIVHKSGAETIAGVKTFSASPIVPAPTTNLHAATKKYVDDTIGYKYFGSLGSVSILTTANTTTSSGFWRISLASASAHPTDMPAGFVYDSGSNRYTHILYTTDGTTRQLKLTDWVGNIYIQYGVSGTWYGWVKNNAVSGATGSFTTVDSKTVTVTDGIITSIV